MTENPAAFLHELTVVSPMGVELGAGGAQWVIAEYDCSAGADDELSFQIGDKIKITRQDDSEWWEGECRGKTGVFPKNYVRMADGELRLEGLFAEALRLRLVDECAAPPPLFFPPLQTRLSWAS